MRCSESGRNGRLWALIAGRTIGGGSAINGMMYLRGQPGDFDRWRDEAGCTGWSFADVLPFFKRAEGSERGGGPWHGGAEPIRIPRGRSHFPIADAFLRTVAEAGLPLVDDLNADALEGFGFYDGAVLNGRRMTAGAHLRYAADRRALDLLTGARVIGLTALGDRIDGVRYLCGGRTLEAKATGEVILAAGCVHTAQLLLLSGIGPTPMLQALGVPILASWPTGVASARTCRTKSPIPCAMRSKRRSRPSNTDAWCRRCRRGRRSCWGARGCSQDCPVRLAA